MERESNSPEPAEAKSDSPVPSNVEGLPAGQDQLEDVIHLLRTDPQALAQVVSQMCPADVRSDGWTPFNRRLFLQVLSETGRVSLGCEYTGMTRQSAYALRARDPLFAAGWDAACELARAPLADALYERAIDGTTETIVRDGEVVATRHRHDSRLSIAVLHRLDRRCDRAEERSSRHLALLRRWDDWLRLVGKGEEQAAQTLLETPLLEAASAETAQHCQMCQLAESANPTEEETEPEEIDLSHHCWRDGIEDIWLTDFPPPQGFTGYESRPYDQDRHKQPYERACTQEEVAILEADEARAAAAERAEHEELRDAWFEYLRSELPSANRHPGLEPGPACPSAAEETRQMPDQVRHDESVNEGQPAFTLPAEEEIQDPPRDPATSGSQRE